MVETRFDLAESFRAFWQDRFGDVEPAGYILRRKYPDRWLRAHALPDGRRYPESDGDRATLLERANRVADCCFSRSPGCWMVASQSESSPQRYRSAWRKTVKSEYGLVPALTWKFDPRDEDAPTYIAHATSLAWKRGAFDSLLLRIAENELAHIIWVNKSSATVFAPYDGGFDVITSDHKQADDLRKLLGDDPSSEIGRTDR